MLERTRDGREIIAAHAVQRRPEGIAKLRIVLARYNNQLVVWTHNLDTGGYSSGKYFSWDRHGAYKSESIALLWAFGEFYRRVLLAEGCPSRSDAVSFAIDGCAPPESDGDNAMLAYTDEIQIELDQFIANWHEEDKTA